MPTLRSTLLIVVLLSSSARAQETTGEAPQATRWSGSYVGDLLSNFAGGLRRGSAYLGMANLGVTFDFQEAGMWQGGTLHLHAAGTHGATPSGSLIGDLQVASNIEAGDHTYVQELWYSQRWTTLEFIVGIQDLNAQFARNEHAGGFLNSSFGVPSTISVNTQTSIFPLTSPGITAIWSPSDNVSLLAALFDGSPTAFDQNPYNLDWHVGSDDGAFVAAEVQYRPGGSGRDGNAFRLGGYRHSHRQDHGEDEPEIGLSYGIYATLDQTVWQTDEGEGVDVFARSGWCPWSGSINPFFMGAGVTYRGLMFERGGDVLGVAFAHAGNRDLPSETTFEITYKMPVSGHLTLQPDLQYIINPAGASEPVAGSVVGVVRFIVEL